MWLSRFFRYRNAPIRLSVEQQAVMDSFISGEPAIAVNAVAGSGKSTLLGHLAQAAIRQGKTGIGTTFNATATADLNRKFVQMSGGRVEKGKLANFPVSTSHSLGRSMMADLYAPRKLPWSTRRTDKGKTIYNPLYTKYADIAKLIVTRATGLTQKDRPEFYRSHAMLEEAVDMARKTLSPPSTGKRFIDMLEMYSVYDENAHPVITSDIESLVQACIDQGEAMFNQGGQHDFTDMIWIPWLKQAKPRYIPDVFFIDEAQDLNAAQQWIAQQHIGPRTQVVVVGDPYQSINGFQGADPESFPSLINNLNAVQFPLSVSFRVPQLIKNEALTWMPGPFTPFQGNPMGTVANMSFDNMMEGPNGPRKGDLIMCRINAPLFMIVFNFISQGKKVHIINKEVAGQLTKFFKIFSESNIGYNKNNFSNFESIAYRYLEMAIENIKEQGRKNSEQQIQGVSDRIEALISVYQYFQSPNENTMWKDINSLFPKSKYEKRRSPDHINLSTIHAMKGGEADRCFIIWQNPSSGRRVLPSPMASQEWEVRQELNMAYVAVTRTKSELYHVTIDGEDLEDIEEKEEKKKTPFPKKKGELLFDFAYKRRRRRF